MTITQRSESLRLRCPRCRKVNTFYAYGNYDRRKCPNCGWRGRMLLLTHNKTESVSQQMADIFRGDEDE